MNSDPRVFFASERTLLAWLRTGIAIIGLGFLVSRFGLFLRLMSLQDPTHAVGAANGHSHLIGVALVVFGAFSMAAAAVQHGRFIATLPEHDRPAAYSRSWALILTGFVTLSSFALAGYLAFTE